MRAGELASPKTSATAKPALGKRTLMLWQARPHRKPLLTTPGALQHHTGCKRYRRIFRDSKLLLIISSIFLGSLHENICYCLLLQRSCKHPAPAQGDVRRAAPWARPVALPTLPGQFRALKLRAAVDTCCDWSMLREAALDITLVVGWLMLLAHPPGSPLRAPTERGCLQSSKFL